MNVMSNGSKASLKAYYALLVTYLKPHWLLSLVLAVLLFGSIGLQLFNPQIMRQFIDTATAAATGSSPRLRCGR